MMKQRKIDTTNLGRDTHVRDHASNRFQAQNHETYGMQIGEIAYTEPEPLFRQNMVTIKLARTGELTSVAYPGAFIDPVTGNLHGTYEGPISGQMVAVGFENGNQATPFVVNRYPYQGAGNTLYESSYINPLTKTNFDATDVMIGHFSGSFLSFNTGVLSGNLPGSVSLNAITDFDVYSNTNISIESVVQAEFKSAQTTIEGTTTAEMTAPQTTIEGTTTADMTAPQTTIEGTTKVSVTGAAIEIESSVGASLEYSVKGETLKTLLEQILDGIAAITVGTPTGGSTVPVNAATFIAIRAQLATMLSTGVKNN